MAEKKSWRDYSKYQNTNSAKTAGTNKANTSDWRNYSKNVDTALSSGNVANSVNGWLDKYNRYITDYQKRYEGRTGGYEDAYVSDSADWLNKVTQQKVALEKEAGDILSYLDQNSGNLDKKLVDELKNTINSAMSNYGNIVKGASDDNAYWNLFAPNEEQAAAGYTAEKIYGDWQASQKQYESDMGLNIYAAEQQLEQLKNNRDAYLAAEDERKRQDESFWDALGRWLGTTSDTTVPLSGATDVISGGSSRTAYDKKIADLEAQIARAKYAQGYEGFMSNMNAADYSAMSKYVSTRNPVKLEDAVFSTNYGQTDAEGNPVIFQEYDTKKLFGNFLHDYINKNEDALTVASRNDVANMSSLLGHDMGFLQTMSKDEIGVYNYIYNTQGQEAADAYLTHIEGDLMGRKRAQEQAFWASYAKSDPVGSSVFSVLTSPLKGVSYIAQAADLLDDGKLDKDAGYNRFSYIPSTIRNQVSTTIEKSGWGKVGSFAYNTGMSMADFLFNTAISGGNQALSLGIMGSGAAADATLAAKDRGLSDWQAFTLGTIAGAAEIAMENISLGAWLNGDMTEGALRYVLKNALSEGVEEAGTSIVNLLADVMIAGNKSEWNMAMQAYIDEGKSPQEAFGLVAAEQAAQIGLDALGGALSGSAIGGGTYAISGIASGFQYRNIAKNKDFAQKLTAEGIEFNPESKYVQKAKTKVEKGKNLTGMQVRNILAKNQEQITANDMKKIRQAAEKRLTDLGQTEKVSELAEIVAKYVTGGELTRAERKLLVSSENGSKAQHDLLQDSLVQEVNSEGYGNKAIRSILDKMASAEHPNAYKSLESRMEGETPAKVSDTGKAVIRGTDTEVDLKKAKVTEFVTDKATGKIKDMVLEVNGKAVKASEIDYADGDQSYLFSAVQKIENITPADATAIVRDYDPSSGLSVSEYLNGVDEGFTYGYHNYSEADLKAGDFAPKLGDTMAKSAYVLGQSAREKSKTAKTDAIKRMRTAVEVEAQKAKAEGKEAPKAKKLTITYNHGGGVVEDIATAEKKLGKLNKWQRGGIEVVKILHQMGIGTDYELFTSYYSKTLKDENGNPLEVFLNDEGQEEAAYAGVYMAADGKIRINLKAYSGTKGLTLNALSHELTHFIKTWSLEKYEAMADFLVKSYGEKGVSMHKLVLKEQARLKGVRGKDVSYTEAYDEVVANAFNRMLEDGKVMDRIADIRQFDKSLADKIIECIRNFINKFTKAYQQNKSLFHETKALMEMKEVFEQLQEMFAEALVEASDNFHASLIAKEAGLEVAPVEDSTQYSYQSLAEAAGFEAVENENGTRSFVRDGQAVSEVTVEDIENSPIGAFINFSLEMGDISDADAKRQKKMFADICTMACKTNDFAMTMQFVGSAVFTGMKANADKQYGTTYDFPSICTKTQAVIDAMSAKMVSLGRGLTTDEIVQLYDDVFASGNPVPCPECYVFSRWIGIGGLLDNIKKYQDYYGDMAVEDVAAEYRKMKAEVSKFAEEQGISFGKAKGALTSKLTKEFNKLTEKIEKQQNQGEKVKASDLKRLEELEPMMNTVKGMTWLENVYFADSSLKKVNPKFRVPNEVLFDLNNGEAFATQYKDAWAFRTTQGAGYGKAITPYAEARLGEGVLVTNNTTNAIKGKAKGSLDNFFLSQMGKLDKKSRDALKRARLKQKIQAFIGGQRFQSTSDARYENASDYLLAALEMQAMRGMVQVYTKVDGAVPAFSAWGFSINQSLMPLNGGLDADGNVKDTGVGGMKPEVAFKNRKNHESAGTITIGVNDNHIRAMFKQLVRDFIIPYHASGGKADVVAAFRRIQEGKEAKGKAVRSTDYSRTQSDKVLSDEVLRWQGKTEAQIQRIHEIRNARIAILTGGNPNMTVVRSNRFLSALYDKLNGGEWDGVKLAKSKVESQIFPNEFWDQTVTYEESAKITKDYLEYCEYLGFLHRFSGMVPSNGKLVPVNGYNENGERVQLTDLAYKYDSNGNKTAEVEEFFWKVLTDRRMYDNNGNYLPQKVVTLNDTTTDTITGFAKNNQGREYDKAKAEALAKKIAGEQYSSQQTDSINVNDVVTIGNGRLAVNINSRASGLHGHRKGEWPALVAGMIRNTLSGKAIIAEDGDIITVTRRGANEVGFGTDTRKLKTEAKVTNDYTKVEQKMITAEHAASIIALSRYSNWSRNTEDLDDMFKRDGLNYRTVEMFIDGDPYTATVVTALNTDETDTKNYGEKFYDIESIEKQTNFPASYGAPSVGTSPHKIKMADSSSDRLTIAQKQRIVNRKNAAYSTGDSGTKTAMEEAFSRAKELKSSQQTDNITDRDMLANAFETISKSSAEYEMIQDYKSNVDRLNKLERELDDVNQEIRKIRFVKGEYNKEKLKVLEGKADRLAKSITKYDKMLLNMEASEPLRKVIVRERKKEAQKTKAHVKEIQQNKKVRAEQTELRHKIRKAVRDLDKILNRGNKKQNVKEDMKGFASKALELADYLFTDHISNDELIRRGITVRMTPKEAALVKETEEIIAKLDAATDINQPDSSLTDEEFTKLDAKRKANEDKLRDLLTAQRNERLNTPVYNLFNDLVTEYASLKNSKQDAVKAAYNEELEKSLRAFMSDDDRVKILKNMRVADMTTEELNWLYRAYTMVLTNVRSANKFFAKGMSESIDNVVTQVVTDFSGRKIPDKKLAIAAQKIANKIGWDYEKLYYALDRIGSDAFTKLIMNIADSENTVMQDVMEAALFRDEMVEKYGFNNWDVNKKIDREFLDNTGKKFTLTLGQLMSLYAYSRREGAWDHIEYGGFVFGEKALTDPKPADSYKLSKEQCEAITGLLTKEQKGYAEDMQKFLSETMGEKGNEVSMLLYGIKMFGEKNYFPIHIAGQFKAQANESQAKAAAGFQSMSNAGFTHAQNPNAKAPFVLEGFNEIWVDHVNEMSRYHGTVPALEDLRRVMNRSSYSESTAESISVKVVMENHFGEEAVEYFDNLYREANSGAITDKLQKKAKKLLSLFRKNSVAYSWSVLIQQPASLVRAYALIDKKYFGFKGFGTITIGVTKAISDKWTKAHTNTYNKMLKYAPGVTMAKEIGGFDTHTGGSIRSYLLDTNKSLKQKWQTGTVTEKGKAVLDVVDNNAIANLPNVADKIAWCEIWNACERETLAKHKTLAPNSEEFLQAVGDRFTEVIRATQVYDSMFAKSPMLKSKNLAVQYVVSFMNEPNTIANMAEKAVRDAARGDWKGGFKTAAVVVHSIIFTNVLKSIIYAMRDDDEDETYIEKYIEAVAGNMMNDFNPLSYIPIARDVWSLAQGYDVERADMAIVSDALDAVNSVIKNATTDTDGMTEEQLVEFDKKVTEANWRLVESLASFFGIPVKNIRREIEGVLDHGRIASANAGQTTAQSAWDKVYEAVIESIPFMQAKNTKQDKLYNAIMSGDKAYLGRLKSTYKDESAYQSAVTAGIRDKHHDGLLDEAGAKNLLMEYADMDEEEAASRVSYWAFCEENPKYAKKITEAKYNKYKEFAEPASISLDVFVQYINGTKDLETIKDEWGDVVVSEREQVLEVIDSLPITWQQKDALYLAHGYAESKIWDVPW